MSSKDSENSDLPGGELDILNRQLDEALSLFAAIETALNEELKLTDAPLRRAEIFARRAACEAALGIEEILERISALPARQTRPA